VNRCLKTASDGADATWRGRSFQTVAPEAGNARLPTVEGRTGGTSRRCEVEDRSRRLDVMSETLVKHDFRMDATGLNENECLCSYSVMVIVRVSRISNRSGKTQNRKKLDPLFCSGMSYNGD